MNIHPMFVHFPIALLSIYSVLEIIRLRIIRQQTYYFYIKATFVIIGACAGIITIPTGILAKLAYGTYMVKIIDTHEIFAITTVVFFSIIAFFYVIGWIRRQNPSKNIPQSLVSIETAITEGWFGILLGVIGLCLISTVGALGGLIAYGPNNDPISAFLYTFLK